MKERIIRLGKALVEELGLEPGVDTLSRWMAHYVAEKMVIAENSSGEEKNRAEEQCFEVILKLWENRASLPESRRPFKNFEPIFRALNNIDPANRNAFYYNNSAIQSTKDDEKSTPQDEEVGKCLKLVSGIDYVARILIEFVFEQAAEKADNDKTKSIIENAANLGNSEDIAVITRLLQKYKGEEEKETIEQIRQEQINNLRLKIEKLDAFAELSSSIRDSLIAELKKVSSKGSDSNNTREF